MPRKAVTSREDMIEGAFRLIRREGHEALTARRLASALSCSTQPIMYQFPNLAELRELAYRRADRFHSDYILSGDGPLTIALNYIRFAAEEAPLFRFLFQSGHFDGASLADMIRRPEAADPLGAIAAGLGLKEDEAAGDIVVVILNRLSPRCTAMRASSQTTPWNMIPPPSKRRWPPSQRD